MEEGILVFPCRSDAANFLRRRRCIGRFDVKVNLFISAIHVGRLHLELWKKLE